MRTVELRMHHVLTVCGWSLLIRRVYAWAREGHYERRRFNRQLHDSH